MYLLMDQHLRKSVKYCNKAATKMTLIYSCHVACCSLMFLYVEQVHLTMSEVVYIRKSIVV